MVFEDRVSKYPGRWTMTKSDGTSEIVTLVRNDEPVKEGTPINAETLNTLSTVAGAINAKDEAVAAAKSAASERAKAEQAATNAANEVKADLKEYSDNAASSAAAAATSESNAKTSETESAKNLQGTKEYFEQVRTITIGAQGWYATPEALKAAVPTGENGWWAVVGTTDTIWTWDSDTGAWVNTQAKVDLSDYLTQTQIKALLAGYMPLRAATATTLGGVKVGSGLTVDADGTLSADSALAAYPVGSIYQSTDATSPAALFGGTWEQIASERVLMGASSSHAAGTTAEAGLPNITGSTGRFASAYGVYDKALADRKQGALSFSGETSDMGYYSSSGSAGYGYYINFNASKSNAIYGKSNTVQPAAYYVHIWRRTA
nr:MAG TPA: baseplate protein [Caudoviricetes sp.]